MYVLLQIAVPFFTPIIIGFLAGKRTIKSAQALDWLNFFIIYIALPPVFFQVVSKTPIDQLTNFVYIFSTSFAAYIAFMLAFVVSILISGRGLQHGVITAGLAGYGNVGYMGAGMVLAALGPEATAPMALIFCFDSLLFFTILPLFIAINQDNLSGKEIAMLIAKRVLLNPFIIATFLGFLVALFKISIPEIINQTLDFLKSAAAPAALFALGVTVSLQKIGRVSFELWFGLFIKLFIHPLLVLSILYLTGPHDPLWVKTAILMAALPPALSVFVIASQFNVGVNQASSGVLLGTILAIPSLLFWLLIIRGGYLQL